MLEKIKKKLLKKALTIGYKYEKNNNIKVSSFPIYSQWVFTHSSNLFYICFSKR